MDDVGTATKADARRRAPLRTPSQHESAASGSAENWLRARMKRDLRIAEQWVERTQARNELIRARVALARAQVKYVELGGDLGAVAFDAQLEELDLVETKVTMTAQQIFYAMAHVYATNEQIAAAVLSTPNAVRGALCELGQRADADFVGLPVFVRPTPRR